MVRDYCEAEGTSVDPEPTNVHPKESSLDPKGANVDPEVNRAVNEVHTSETVQIRDEPQPTWFGATVTSFCRRANDIKSASARAVGSLFRTNWRLSCTVPFLVPCD